jgi:hypothetical protein
MRSLAPMLRTTVLPLALLVTPSVAAAQLLDTEALVTCAGCGFNGADVSDDTSGAWGYNVVAFRLAEEFTVTSAAGWNVSTITLFAYQTLSPTAPCPITSVNMQIWDGPPGPGSAVVWGDTTTNVFQSGAWSNIYRVHAGVPQTNTDRAVFAVTCTVGTQLAMGTYYVDFSMPNTSAFSGPWAPTNSNTSTSTARQTNNNWATSTVILEQVPLIIDGGGGSLGSNYCTTNPNSTGASSSISAQGSATVAMNNVTLMCSNLPLNAFAFFLTSRTQGFVANPGGSQGNLCLAGAIGRYVGPGQIQNSGATGAISLVLDLTVQPTPTGPVPVMAGETWNFQCWHRDAVGGTATSNFSNGLEIAFL